MRVAHVVGGRHGRRWTGVHALRQLAGLLVEPLVVCAVLPALPGDYVDDLGQQTVVALFLLVSRLLGLLPRLVTGVRGVAAIDVVIAVRVPCRVVGRAVR